jgi:hypothetical protein
MDIGELKSYEIDGNSLTYQATGDANYSSAVGITVNESEYGKWLFCTFEFENVIELIDAQTMEPDGEITVPNTYSNNLAGIVIDNSESKLYVVERFTNRLWSYSWNPATKTLTPNFDAPYYIELKESGSFGIALDETNRLLYIANNTDGIAYYNTNDWSKVGEVNTPCNVISVAVDVGNQLLYFGNMGDYGEGDPCLYQYDLLTDEINSVNVGNSVAGIAVDQETGFVYITTYSDSYGGDLIICDRDLNQHGNPIWLNSPAGLCVPYNYTPLPEGCELEFSADDDTDCVPQNGSFNYNICAMTTACTTLTDVNIVLILPPLADFNSTNKNGDYTESNHSVTWHFDSLEANDINCVWLKVDVSPGTAQGAILSATAKIYIDSNLYSTQRINTSVCCDYNTVFVDDNAPPNGDGHSWQSAFRELSVALQNVTPCTRQIFVAAGTYYPTDANDPSPSSKTFALIDGIDIYGHFAGDWETNINQRNLAT